MRSRTEDWVGWTVIWEVFGIGTTTGADGKRHFPAGLEEGLHTVTLKATDPMGQIGSDYMTVNVESRCLADTDCDFDEDGFTEEEGDCDDNRYERNPDAPEIYNEIDDNCDGVIDEGTDAHDDDGDGYTEIQGDCDDADSEVSPDAEEIQDEIDNDCDGFIDEGTDIFDDDEDGYSEADGDCDDADAAVSPGADEVQNGIDDDCDGFIDEGSDAFDDDEDGYSEDEGDCDDADPDIHPEAIEVCDEIDNDCDGDIDAEDSDTDQDADDSSVCDEVPDCDDDDPDIHPEAIEVCDEIDNDCDEYIDAEDEETDSDEDGFSICDEEPDCDDDDDTIFPGSIEICDLFEVDEDCDGEINEEGAEGSEVYFVDSDGDGYGRSWETALFCSLPATGYSDNGDDCDDDVFEISPEAVEVCGDGLDNDCDWAIDGADSDTDGDGDGFSACGATPAETDCNDSDPDISPADPEVCGDSVDNDCDGSTDDRWSGRCHLLRRGDGDGLVTASTIAACAAPEGFVTNDDDCNDGNFAIKPTATKSATWSTATVMAPPMRMTRLTLYWYFDGDDDGYGSTATVACSAPSADYVPTSGDCNDTEPAAYPGAR